MCAGEKGRTKDIVLFPKMTVNQILQVCLRLTIDIKYTIIHLKSIHKVTVEGVTLII